MGQSIHIPQASLASASQISLLEAVLEIIVEGGVDAVRYRAVAEHAGVSLGTVSYHYKSRELLITAALKYYLEENTRELMSLRDKFVSRNLQDVADYLVEVCKRDFKDKRKRVYAEYELMVFAARDTQVARDLENFENAMIGELARELDRVGIPRAFAAARTLSEMMRGFQLMGLGSKKHNYEEFGLRIRSVLAGLKQGDGCE